MQLQEKDRILVKGLPQRNSSEENEQVEVSYVKTYIEQIKRPLSKFNCVGNDVHVSIFEGLSLINYIEARRYVCCKRHTQPCILCSAMLEVAQKIVEEGYMKLKVAFEAISANITYTASHAHRKLLQMPLASLGISERSQGNYCIFLVKKHSSVHYNIFKSLLSRGSWFVKYQGKIYLWF